MKKGWSSLALGACLALTLNGAAQATVITTTVGDKDGFGGGVLNAATFDIGFDVSADASDAAGTDTVLAAASITLNYALPPSPATGWLTIFSGGWGKFDLAEVKLNGATIGVLTSGEANDGSVSAHLDAFVLTSTQLALLTGSDTVTINPVAGPEVDTGVIDFIELTLNTDAQPPAVPEPASLGLTGLALALLAATKTRRRY